MHIVATTGQRRRSTSGSAWTPAAGHRSRRVPPFLHDWGRTPSDSGGMGQGNKYQLTRCPHRFSCESRERRRRFSIISEAGSIPAASTNELESRSVTRSPRPARARCASKNRTRHDRMSARRYTCDRQAVLGTRGLVDPVAVSRDDQTVRPLHERRQGHDRARQDPAHDCIAFEVKARPAPSRVSNGRSCRLG